MIKMILFLLKTLILKLKVNRYKRESSRRIREHEVEIELIKTYIKTAITNRNIEDVENYSRRLESLQAQALMELKQTDDIMSTADKLRNEFEQKIIIPAKRNELKPPPGAEKILALMLTPDRLEEVLGDFEEGYHEIAKRHGLIFARNWYRWEVAMVPVVGAAKLAWRAAKAWFWFGGVGSA